MVMEQSRFGVVALYWRLVVAQARGQVQYRVSFALQVIGAFAGTFIDLLGVLVLFHRFPTLAGWSLGEIAFLYGVGGVAFALADMFTGGFDTLSAKLISGEFDRVLIRPLGAFFQTAAADVQLRRIGRIAQALVAFAIALRLVDVHWTALKLLLLLLTVLSGAVIFGSIFIIGAGFTFWTVQTLEVTNIFTYGGSEMVAHPITIYAGWLRRFFAFVIPLAFVTYYPALYILDRPDPLGGPRLLQFLSPLAAALAFLVARLVWGAGVRHYQSAGS